MLNRQSTLKDDAPPSSRRSPPSSRRGARGTMPPPDRYPYPSHWTVARALDAYLAENGFTKEAYDAPTAEVSFLNIPMRIPNPPSRQRAVRFHDLHHVATDFGTDFRGEVEISAWEIRRSLRGAGLYVRFIITYLALFGFVIAPLRSFRAWTLSRAGRNSLFQDEVPYEELLTWTVGDLRKHLSVLPGGISERPRQLHSKAP